MSYILFQGSLLFICNFPTHNGGKPSKFLMSVIALPYHIPDCCWKSLLLNRSHQTPVMYKFTAVSIVQSEFVVLYGVFLSNHCHSCAGCTRWDSEWFDGVMEHLKTARSFNFMFTVYPPNHVWPFEPKCIYNSKQVIGGYCINDAQDG